MKWAKFLDRIFDTERKIFGALLSTTLGILLPILCLLLDPFIFRRWDNAPSLMTKYQVFVYTAVTLGLLTLLLWLVFNELVQKWAGLISGILLSGAIFALIIGLILLPFSLLGLLIIIGIFGFTPFLSSVVFYYHGTRAWNIASAYMEKKQLELSFSLGVIFVIAVPLFTQWQTSRMINQSVTQIIQADAPTVYNVTKVNTLRKFFPAFVELKTAELTNDFIQDMLEPPISTTSQDLQRLKVIGWCTTCFDEIVWLYSNEIWRNEETSELNAQLLREIYQEITGDNIRERLQKIEDD